MPGNSVSSLAAMSCSSSTKRWASGSSRKRGSSGGTLTRAKRSSPVAESRTVTARFSERFEMYGNGWAGSTASGVSTGKMLSVNRIVEIGAVVVGQLGPLGETDAVRRRARARAPWRTRRLRARRASLDPGADLAEQVDEIEAVGDRRAEPGRELLHEPGDAHLEELVEVLAHDREELAALQQRDSRVFGEREDTRDEVEEGELSVQVTHADRRTGLGFGPHADSDVDAAHRATVPGDPAVRPRRRGAFTGRLLAGS